MTAAAIATSLFFEISFMRRANLEKMEGKDLAVVLHHLETKRAAAKGTESEIAMLQRQLIEQVTSLVFIGIFKS